MRRVDRMKLIVALLVFQAGLSSAAMAAVHNAAAEYQLTKNPSLGDHGWVYLYESEEELITTIDTYSRGEWGTTQAWRPSGSEYLGWAKITDNPGDWDAQLGDLVTHDGPVKLTYVFGTDNPDTSGVATISGSLWNPRHAVPPNHGSIHATWTLYKNNMVLSTGTTYGYTLRSAPDDLTAGSGGAAALEDIPYHEGDSFSLEITPLAVGGDYRGVNFTITTNPVGVSVVSPHPQFHGGSPNAIPTLAVQGSIEKALHPFFLLLQ